ncbi:MAG: restriction endonuclease subunit S [Oscillospiraceae bacterium]|nr:restriction endonuclease subunit S [Oscillospiraceae bacterium]
MMWFGELPKRWKMQKISELFSERKTKVSDIDFTPLSVSKAGIVPQIATVAKSNAGDDRKLVLKGDFVINSRSDRRGSSGVSKYDGSVSLINIVLKPRTDINGKYYHYLLRSHYFIEEYYRNGRGIVADLWTTRYSEMRNIYIPLPPREEQDQIVRFLDSKVSQINKLINAKRKKIALLQEQKLAMINQIVTRGLNLNASMKYSGIMWLGDIPVKWHIRSFSKIAKVCSNLVKPQDNLDMYQVSPASIEKHTGRLLSYSTVKETGIISDNHRFYKGQILYSKIRPMLNKVTIAPFDGLCSADMYPIETKLQTKYLMYFMLSSTFLSQLTMTGNRVKMPKINQEELSCILIFCPPDEEQTRIVTYLETKSFSFNKLFDSIKNEINHIIEYRTRLISDVVTGKVNIHCVKVPDYETVEDIAFNDNIIDENGDLDDEPLEENDITEN